MKRTHQTGSAHVIIIICLVVALLGALGWIFWQNFVSKDDKSNNISSYAECVADPGSKIQESYPEVCVTKDGKSFTNPDQRAVQPKIEDHETYCSKLDNACFQYPKDWSLVSKATSSDESVTLTSAQGVKALSITFAVGGIGCTGGSFKWTSDIKQIYNTKIEGMRVLGGVTHRVFDETLGYEDSSERGTDEWFPLAVLTSDEKITEGVQSYGSPCFTAGILKLEDEREIDGVTRYSNVLDLGKDFRGTYKTKDEALTRYKSDEFQKLVKVLASFYRK